MALPSPAIAAKPCLHPPYKEVCSEYTDFFKWNADSICFVLFFFLKFQTFCFFSPLLVIVFRFVSFTFGLGKIKKKWFIDVSRSVNSRWCTLDHLLPKKECNPRYTAANNCICTVLVNYQVLELVQMLSCRFNFIGFFFHLKLGE